MQSEKRPKPPGFRGNVTNTSLPDVIQLICIGRNSCRIKVRSGVRKGVISIQEGEIVHAETDQLDGEEAFYEIVGWELGMFDCDSQTPEKQTIQESWDFLLMEAMRRLESVS